jgi:nucleotide sugar dehydrogenase
MGYVGASMAQQLKGAADLVTYDIADSGPHPSAELARCDVTFVCVDTPMSRDGSCDTSHVEDAVAQLSTELVVIRSTVPPGTTDALAAASGGRLCHFPEFYGEGQHTGLPRPQRLQDIEFCVIGGPAETRDAIVSLLAPLYGPRPVWHRCRAIESEIIKYMENAFLATKVAFANEFFDICAAFGADWHTVREGWLLDPRVGRSHTAVFEEDRGFDGNCLPKDLAAIVRASMHVGYEPTLLRGVDEANAQHRSLPFTEDQNPP